MPHLTALLLLAAAPLQAPAAPSPDPSVSAAFAAWRAEHGSQWILRAHEGSGTARLLFGGGSPASFLPRDEAEWEELAWIALDRTHGMFQLDPMTLVVEGVAELQLSRIGSSDKTAVRLQQQVRGVPVVGASVSVLFGPEAVLLAVDSSALPRLLPFDTRPAGGPFAAIAAARREFLRLEGLEPVEIDRPELVILPHGAGAAFRPRLAWSVELRAAPSDRIPAGRRIFVAADEDGGRILAAWQRVHALQGDLIGRVESWATPGVLPDIPSNPETLQTMRFLEVTSAAGNAVTDRNGDFVIPYAGATPVEVTARYRGPWARVNNFNGAEHAATAAFAPGVPGQLVMNPAQAAAVTAQANAFDSIIDCREFIKAIDPADDTMDFPVAATVNFFLPCNAVFTGSSILLFRAGAGCVNTAYSTVVVHEEGHWANERYGSGNGPDGFGEGNADVWAMYVYDTPIVGENFAGSTFVRTGNNTRQFCGDANPGCYGEVHDDGEVLMGALWKVRRNLNSSLGNAAGDLVADTLFLSWMNAYDDGQIRTVIEDHWLVLDDDDANLANGTPNFAEIDGAFREQGFPGVNLNVDTIALAGPASANVGDLLAFSYSGAPAGARTWLAWSLDLSGSMVAGHPFDLGRPFAVAAAGTSDPNGSGSWTIGPVPATAGGRTLHFEVAALAGTDLFDSNPVTVVVQ